jgi:hypothetical protein
MPFGGDFGGVFCFGYRFTLIPVIA